jgi:hypothetical protein
MPNETAPESTPDSATALETPMQYDSERGMYVPGNSGNVINFQPTMTQHLGGEAEPQTQPTAEAAPPPPQAELVHPAEAQPAAGEQDNQINALVEELRASREQQQQQFDQTMALMREMLEQQGRMLELLTDQGRGRRPEREREEEPEKPGERREPRRREREHVGPRRERHRREPTAEEPAEPVGPAVAPAEPEPTPEPAPTPEPTPEPTETGGPAAAEPEPTPEPTPEPEPAPEEVPEEERSRWRHIWNRIRGEYAHTTAYIAGEVISPAEQGGRRRSRLLRRALGGALLLALGYGVYKGIDALGDNGNGAAGMVPGTEGGPDVNGIGSGAENGGDVNALELGNGEGPNPGQHREYWPKLPGEISENATAVDLPNGVHPVLNSEGKVDLVNEVGTAVASNAEVTPTGRLTPETISQLENAKYVVDENGPHSLVYNDQMGPGRHGWTEHGVTSVENPGS